MGIMSNTTSLTQFVVNGELTIDEILSCLEKFSFQPIDNSSEESSLGWAVLDDKDNTGFVASGDCCRDHYIVFTMRSDTRKVPAAVLRSHLNRAYADFLAENPNLNRVPKEDKEAIRDAVKAELLRKVIPTPRVVDVVWDTSTGIITLATLSGKAVEAFGFLFSRTFPTLRHTLFYPFLRAKSVVSKPLAGSLDQINQANSENVVDQILQNTWIGEDFLRWLLYHTMESSSEYEVVQEGHQLQGARFVAFIDKRLTLVSNCEQTQKLAVTGPQNRFSEVKAALQEGKTISDATIFFELDELNWNFTLRGTEFIFASFKTPKVKIDREAVDQGLEAQGMFLEKMMLLESGLQLFDSILATFLAQRLSEDWPGIDKQIDDWFREPKAA